jgi:hypothetical protein
MDAVVKDGVLKDQKQYYGNVVKVINNEVAKVNTLMGIDAAITLERDSIDALKDIIPPVWSFDLFLRHIYHYPDVNDYTSFYDLLLDTHLIDHDHPVPMYNHPGDDYLDDCGIGIEDYWRDDIAGIECVQEANYDAEWHHGRSIPAWKFIYDDEHPYYLIHKVEAGNFLARVMSSLHAGNDLCSCHQLFQPFCNFLYTITPYVSWIKVDFE